MKIEEAKAKADREDIVTRTLLNYISYLEMRVTELEAKEKERNEAMTDFLIVSHDRGGK